MAKLNDASTLNGEVKDFHSTSFDVSCAPQTPFRLCPTCQQVDLWYLVPDVTIHTLSLIDVPNRLVEALWLNFSISMIFCAKTPMARG